MSTRVTLNNVTGRNQEQTGRDLKTTSDTK